MSFIVSLLVSLTFNEDIRYRQHYRRV